MLLNILQCTGQPTAKHYLVQHVQRLTNSALPRSMLYLGPFLDFPWPKRSGIHLPRGHRKEQKEQLYTPFPA